MSREGAERTILVIDDELSIREMSKLLLEERGYQVLTATHGEEGLILAKVKRPDVILLDLVMPKMSGHQVLQRLKQDPDTKAIPVIVVTARGAEHDRAASFRLGAIDHIEKPYRTEEILQKIKVALILSGRDATDRTGSSGGGP